MGCDPHAQARYGSTAHPRLRTLGNPSHVCFGGRYESDILVDKIATEECETLNLHYIS